MSEKLNSILKLYNFRWGFWYTDINKRKIFHIFMGNECKFLMHWSYGYDWIIEMPKFLRQVYSSFQY